MSKNIFNILDAVFTNFKEKLRVSLPTSWELIVFSCHFEPLTIKCFLYHRCDAVPKFLILN